MRSSFIILLLIPSLVSAGAIVTLTPEPPEHPSGYRLGEVVRVDISIQLDANSPATIRARLIQFDTSDSSDELVITPIENHPGADIGPIPFWNLGGSTTCANDETSCGTNYFIDGSLSDATPQLLNLTYTGLTTSGSFMVVLRQSNPVYVGSFNVTLPEVPGEYLIDVLNADEVDNGLGGEIRHGFGVTADPGSTRLRASAGEITGGAWVWPGLWQFTDCDQNGTIDADEDCNANNIPDHCETNCGGSLCGCLGEYAGEYSGPSAGTVQSSLNCDSELTFRFTSQAGPILFQSAATMDEQGVIAGAGQKIKVNGQMDFESCTAEGTWSLAGGETGEWFSALTRECLPDCNENEVPDHCEIRDEDSEDCNENSIPDECDLATLSSFDCNNNQIPDECEDPPVFAITFSNPADGTVDVRQDRSVTGQTAQGFDRVRMSFTCEPHDAKTSEPMTAESFLITATSGIPPLVLSVFQTAQPYTYDIIFSDPIPAGAWTTITAIVESPDGVAIDPDANSVTLGFLPGDISGNGRSTPADLLALVDHLNGITIPPLHIRQCDVDRSNSCHPADILRMIDLLNGVNTTRAWNGATLPPMP